MRLMWMRRLTVALGCVALASCVAPEKTSKNPESGGAVRSKSQRTTEAPYPSPSPRGSATPNEAATPVSQATPEAGTSPPFAETTSSLPLRLPAPAVRRVIDDPRIKAIKEKLAKYPTYDGHRALAELYVKRRMFQEAAQAYRAEAAMYRRAGMTDAATIQANKAARYDTTVQLFLDRDTTVQEEKALYTGAPLEPKTGCYIGAFIDRDDQLQQVFSGDNWQWHRHPNEFAALVGKPHATYFTYVRYGQNFPRKWLAMCKRENVIPHIAWEPKSLSSVNDDQYLRDCGETLRALDWPVFIRFAGEMNGHWTPYHSNPTLYREKFRLVHRVLHRYAPKVATIWCVNSVPSDTIPDYYPGDDGCDWVGVNLYSTPFYDNDRTRSAFLDTPLTLIDPIYKRYAARKPIAICEYGASHMASLDRKLRNDFAVDKMSQLYSALPRLYPRIKMISWFSSNNLRHAKPGRQLNNYSLTEQPSILNAYRKLISGPYFLGAPEQRDEEPPVPRPLRTGQNTPEQARFSIWVKTYVPRPTVLLKVGEDIVYAGRQAGAHTVNVDLEPFRAGRLPLTVYVYDDKGRFVSLKKIGVALKKA
jgi:hypothetical protein